MSKTITISITVPVTLRVEVAIRDGQYTVDHILSAETQKTDVISAIVNTNYILDKFNKKCAAVLGPLPEPEDA